MGEELYRRRLFLIEQTIRSVARRQALTPDLAEEFASYVHEKLIRDDYAVLRAFRGESSLKTFLHVTITRLGLDFRNHKWGKWRPSAAARRIGESAVRLETLVYRDGYTLVEAAEIMRTNLGLDITSEQVDDLAARLPNRTRRRFEGEEALESFPSDQDLEKELIREEKQQALQLLEQSLKNAMTDLDSQDRLILRMHFEQGLSWTQVGAVLSIPRRILYRRKDTVLRRLRRRLENAGVTRLQVASLFEEDLGK